MKPIELNKFEDFKFLSALKLSGKGNEIFFVVTKVDKENNKVAGKIVKGKFEYAGPNESALVI